MKHGTQVTKTALVGGMGWLGLQDRGLERLVTPSSGTLEYGWRRMEIELSTLV